MLRRVTPAEIPYFYDTLYKPYIEELRQYGGCDGMTLSRLIYHLSHEPMEALVFDVNGSDAGFVIIEHVSNEELYVPMDYIIEFYVRGDCRRKGIGSEAFSELLEMTDRPFFFTVLTLNESAAAFWRRQIALNDLRPVRPDPGQIRFAGNAQLFCLRKSR